MPFICSQAFRSTTRRTKRMDTNQNNHHRLIAQSTLMPALTDKTMTNHTKEGCYSLHTSCIIPHIWWTYIPVWDNVLVTFLAESALRQDQRLLEAINIVWGTMAALLHYRTHMVDIYTSVRWCACPCSGPAGRAALFVNCCVEQPRSTIQRHPALSMQETFGTYRNQSTIQAISIVRCIVRALI